MQNPPVQTGLGDIHFPLAHIGILPSLTEDKYEKLFDFEAEILELVAFFPKGQSAQLKVFISVDGNNIIKSFTNDSNLEYLAGDDFTFKIPLLQPLLRNQHIEIICKNEDTINSHRYYIWMTIKKKRRI